MSTQLITKKILALDVATHCGWKTETASGVWDLSPKRDESKGMRLIRFRAKLREIIQLEQINIVVFEQASGFHKNALIVEAELIGVMKLCLEEANIDYRSYTSTNIKKFATGKGVCKKDLMIKAAQEKFGYTGNDDNEADAICLYHLALNDLKFIK